MKSDLIIAWLVWILFVIISYLVTAFIFLDINAAHWNWIGRLIFIAASVIWGFGSMKLYDKKSADK